MRILFLTENFPPETNAAASRIHERAVYWTQWGHEITVITTAPNFPQGKVFPGYKNRWYQVETIDGIRVVRVKSFMTANDGFLLRILDFLSFMFSGFVAGLVQKRPDVVVSNSPQMFTAVAGWALTAIRRLPFVFELADLWPASIIAVGAMRQSLLLRGLEQLELFLYRRASVIIALTKAFQTDLIRRGIPANKIKVVRNGVDLTRYTPCPRNTLLEEQYKLQSVFTIGYVGTHGMAHDLENVLRAARYLQDRKDICFLFIGTGADRNRLMALAQQQQLDNVLFIPNQPKSRMPDYWSLCDVALVHLKNDPVFETVIPSKIFEAMGMGLPILLVSPPGEVKEIMDEEQVGLHVPAGDPQALAAAAVTLRDDANLYQTSRQNSRQAAPKYSRERQAQEFMTALQPIADRQQNARP